MDDFNIRYVAHIDILGMSAIVNKDLDEAWRMLSDLVDVKDFMSNHEIEFTNSNERFNLRDQIATVVFSDTIILFTKGATSIELRCIIILLTEIFHKALCRCIPIRAGLSIGDFYFNSEKSMYAGPALINSYNVGEASQWLGISLHKSVWDEALKLDMKSGNSDVIINCEIPIKHSCTNGYAINWPAIFHHDMEVQTPVTVEQFYKAFQSRFGVFDLLPDDVKSKYINTVNFMNKQVDDHIRNTNQ